MSELLGEGENKRKVLLKELIKRLHKGEDPESVKEEFKKTIQALTPADIAKVEEELIKEGMPREQVQKLCDVHLAVFKESLDKETILTPAGHPIHILMEEHKMLLKFADKLKDTAKEIDEAKDFNFVGQNTENLNHITEHLKESESHYLREENVPFPYLEKHGITQPPAIMWTEHNRIREIEKDLYKLVNKCKEMVFKDFAEKLKKNGIIPC